MLNTMTNKAIVTKARAMYGKRITSTQYDEMIKCRSVNDLATYLKNETHFQTILFGINESNIHRGQLENLLRRDVFDQYTKLYHFTTSSHNDMFQSVIMEEEIKEILRMVLLLKAKNPQSYILDLPAYLISKAHVDLMEMAKVTTYDELIQVLGNTEYAAILRKYQPNENHPTISYIACEHAFYEYFFEKTRHMIRQVYRSNEQYELLRLLGIRIDLLNLTNIYRAKALFQTSEKNALKRVFPFYRKLSAQKIQEIAACDSKEAVEQKISNWFGKVGQYGIEWDSNSYIEKLTDRITYHISRQYIHTSTHSSAVFYAFHTLSQLELTNVINIIEGIRYQISQDEIQNLIVR